LPILLKRWDKGAKAEEIGGETEGDLLDNFIIFKDTLSDSTKQ
jgi:hypothetical protein